MNSANSENDARPDFAAATEQERVDDRYTGGRTGAQRPDDVAENDQTGGNRSAKQEQRRNTEQQRGSIVPQISVKEQAKAIAPEQTRIRGTADAVEARRQCDDPEVLETGTSSAMLQHAKDERKRRRFTTVGEAPGTRQPVFSYPARDEDDYLRDQMPVRRRPGRAPITQPPGMAPAPGPQPHTPRNRHQHPPMHLPRQRHSDADMEAERMVSVESNIASVIESTRALVKGVRSSPTKEQTRMNPRGGSRSESGRTLAPAIVFGDNRSRPLQGQNPLAVEGVADYDTTTFTSSARESNIGGDDIATSPQASKKKPNFLKRLVQLIKRPRQRKSRYHFRQ